MLPALLLAADLAGSFSVSDRTELRVRAPGTPPAAASFDAETAITADLALTARRWGLSLSYTPRFTLWDIGNSAFAPTQLQAGRAHIDWTEHHVHLSLDQSGGYGSVNFASTSFAPGAEGQPPRIEPVPTTAILQLESSTTTLASRITLPRWTIDLSAGYQLAGGADAAARALLPLQQGPLAEVSTDYAGGRRDHVVTKLSASETSFSSGPEDILGEVDLGWKHFWSRGVDTRLSAGVAEAHQRTSTVTAGGSTTYPVVEAALEHRRGPVEVQVNGRLGPTVNRLFGLVEQWAQGSVVARYRYRRLTTHVFGSAWQTVSSDDPYATSLLAGELGVAYDATEVVSFDAGTRAIWQRTPPAGSPYTQGTVFAGISLHAPRVRW